MIRASGPASTAAQRSGPERRDGRLTATGAMERRRSLGPERAGQHTAPRRAPPTILALEPSVLIPNYLARAESLTV
ncbi:jg13738 [Pararge aegeria aegeria]|uniref:Jg13738 protein n=1 Tax=Pararge aegeria aegeria TaxID=348720 RepID=A0A8S4RP51_9NEOP|nr:jg13738 [Pararge aegeria aegeria]